MSNFKSAAKRKRELAKLDKRQAKEQRRAVRRAERSAAGIGAPTPATSALVAQPAFAKQRHSSAPPASPRPTTLAEAVELWRTTKVVKPRKR
jgi:hypothetical protein